MKNILIEEKASEILMAKRLSLKNVIENNNRKHDEQEEFKIIEKETVESGNVKF